MEEKGEELSENGDVDVGEVFVGGIILGLIAGGGGVASYFIWFQGVEIEALLISEAFFWIAFAAVSVGVVFLIKEEFKGAVNEYISKGLRIAVILGLVMTGCYFSGADFINRISMNTGSLFFTAGIAFLLGVFIWKIQKVPVYGQFGYVLVLTSGIGLTWFARLSGGQQAQIVVGSFLIGALLYFGHYFLNKGMEHS